MKLRQAIKRLEALGSAQTRKTYGRHGVDGPMFGVKYGDLDKLTKEIGVDHALALELFASGNHDACVLATKIVDPQQISSRELDAWIATSTNHVINGGIASVAAKSRFARKKADAWRKVKKEMKSSAGWNIVSQLAADPEADTKWLATCLTDIKAGISSAPNRTRYSMNNALISIGGYHESLRKKALSAAKAIGKVEVDHGLTNCKTPDAASYIKKMADHAAKKAKAHKARAKKAG
jgi:3-methyladenine DNA glycosylase AlkD